MNTPKHKKTINYLKEMKFWSITLLVLTIASADNWAVLIYGSLTYDNYRHHADVAHAY